MSAYWDLMFEPVFIEPILARRLPGTIIEIGADQGDTTRLLLDFCRRHDAVLHCIDPRPQFDTAALRAQHGSRLIFHQGLSLQVLPHLDRFDVVLIDGDHNWYTVFHELKLIESRCREMGQPFPVVLFHDVGWPYGRRDMYYNPESIPPAYRHPHARKGMLPGVSALQEQGGVNAPIWNADHEHGPRNGVLTAVEDFQKEAQQPLELVTVPGHHGFAALFPPDLPGQDLVPFLRSFQPPPVLKQYLERFEGLRIGLESCLLEHRAALVKCQSRLKALGQPVPASPSLEVRITF